MQERWGGMSLWDRIASDPEYLKTKQSIQKKYDLPLQIDSFTGNQKWFNWMLGNYHMDRTISERRQEFIAEVHALFKRFEVPESWQYDFLEDIVGHPYSASKDDPSLPAFELYPSLDGTLKWRCIVTPETDLTNPINLQMIQLQQKRYAGYPPAPIQSGTNELDWRPVYEWYQRHPLFTVEEIAEMIDYPVHKVKMEIEKLEGREQSKQ